MNRNRTYKYLMILSLIAIAILGRLLPHLPNTTPFVAMAVFTGTLLPRKAAYCSIIFLGLIVSDILLAYLNHHPIFGTWSLFTYSGFLLMAFFNAIVDRRSTIRLFSSTLVSSLLFWVWTNFGVWLLDNMYSFDIKGIIACYTAALPFLKNSIVGDQIWMLLLLLGFGYFKMPKQFSQDLLIPKPKDAMLNEDIKKASRLNAHSL